MDNMETQLDPTPLCTSAMTVSHSDKTVTCLRPTNHSGAHTNTVEGWTWVDNWAKSPRATIPTPSCSYILFLSNGERYRCSQIAKHPGTTHNNFESGWVWVDDSVPITVSIPGA